MKQSLMRPGKRRFGWLYRDEFNDPLAAGAVDGTPAVPGPGTRTVVDTYAETEMVLNPGFETAGAGGADVFANWVEAAGTGAIADEGVIVKSGDHAAKLTGVGDAGNPTVTQDVAVIPGFTYNFSVWARGDGVNAGRFYISDVTNGGLVVPVTNAESGIDYVQKTASFVAPAGCILARLYFSSATVLGSIAYFDDVSLKPTTGLLSMGEGQLKIAGGQSVAVEGDAGLWGDGFARSTGLAVLSSIRNLIEGKAYRFGLDNNQTGGTRVSFTLNAGFLQVRDLGAGSAAVGEHAFDVDYKLAVIERSIGSIFLIKGGAFANWTIVWVSNEDDTALLYPSIITLSAALTAGYLRVLQLPAPFDTDNGLATDVLAGEVGSNSTFVHQPDFLLEFTCTALADAGEYYVLYFRETDASNYWYVVIKADGAVELWERVSGGGTGRGSAAAGSIAAGQRIVLIAEGTTIRLYANNVLKITYESALAGTDKTDGHWKKYSTGTITDLITYPRTIKSKLLEEASK